MQSTSLRCAAPQHVRSCARPARRATVRPVVAAAAANSNGNGAALSNGNGRVHLETTDVGNSTNIR